MFDPSSHITFEQVVDHIVGLVAWAREHYGIVVGMSGEDACEALGLSLRRENLIPGTLGLLSESRRLIIVNSSIERATRVEFTIYHEIVHYLINQNGELLEYFLEKLSNPARDLNRVMEEWCDVGAAEFLIPRDHVREAIADKGFSVDLVEYLADTHRGASLQAVTTQLATYAPIDCYVVICAYGVAPIAPFPVALHVEHASKRFSMKYPWRRGSQIPEGHLLHQVWEGKQRMSGPTKVVFPSGKTKLPCADSDAKPLGNDRVVAILYIDKLPARTSQRQLELLL